VLVDQEWEERESSREHAEGWASNNVDGDRKGEESDGLEKTSKASRKIGGGVRLNQRCCSSGSPKNTKSLTSISVIARTKSGLPGLMSGKVPKRGLTGS